MSVANKVKALLNLKNKDRAGLAAHLGISNQALNNKFYRDSFSVEDIIKIADYTGVTVAFVAEDTEIVLDAKDITEK